MLRVVSHEPSDVGLFIVADRVLVFSAITDLLLASFPILILRRLQISFRTKIALCVLMGLGVMYAVISLCYSACTFGLTRLKIIAQQDVA